MKGYGIFDTHAHYDHELFAGRGPELLKSMFDRNVISGAVIPAITFESNFCRDEFPKEEFPFVYFAAGLHPKCVLNEPFWGNLKCAPEKLAEPRPGDMLNESSGKNSGCAANETSRREPGGVSGESVGREQEDGTGEADQKQDRLARILNLVRDERTVALKTGLDFYKKKLTDGQKEHQKRFLKLFIQMANHYRLPLVFHVRNAAEEFLEVIRENPINVEAVVHCFNYDADTARAMMDAGITRFGIGGMLTRDEMEPLRECVKELPLSGILFETDAPFVRPKGYDGEINTSETLIGTARLAAELKGISVEEMVEAANKNAEEFYRYCLPPAATIF